MPLFETLFSTIPAVISVALFMKTLRLRRAPKTV